MRPRQTSSVAYSTGWVGSTIHNTSFTKGVSVQLSTSSGDFDASGDVLFETSADKVVTVQYAFDNATTLGKQNVCTVFGSVVAS